MANTLKIRRGTKATLPTLAAGEPGWCTDTYELYVGDGAVNRPVVLIDQIECSENLVAGNFVNIYDATGVKCRKADATAVGKEANGFVLAAYTSGQTAVVYRISQTNTQLTGMTPGKKQYLATTAGGRTETPPSASGNVVQMLGIAKSATEMIFAPNDPIVLA